MGSLSWLLTFPQALTIDIGRVVDDAVAYLSRAWAPLFSVIGDVLLGFVNSIQSVVSLIPWWVMLGIVFLLGWRLTKRARQGMMYASMLFIVGLLGLWELMTITLGLVLASVLISLIIGLPIGILVAGSGRAESVVKPLLDAMQTMPTFVYLIPAVMFFGLGKVPGVIATTIYAVPPVIRLTCHGIRQVDKEVVEAALSFGSTKAQVLFKVQIPLALPTIMTGVNQTLMMAMAMVVTCAMIGVKGLGYEVIIGINRLEIGRGLKSGIAIVILAVLLDRLTQGWFKADEKLKERNE
ncbi:MAG TPA: proline/glycine betaine ABC transporter permease [Bacillota bacterium]|nr:proline/glycine betaine ABC transporter permease [Bacillota bacterium]HOH10629.1 proline/glycine betaine ABC transporter permease [Bacillota bacterium]HOY88897.1 proline/glycine betaine ABC transporter permease [Bacillota bacterium]HPI01770.1 proline/glycine betaine ABC transporter permease [Bacillota bacterium]HPM63678.1 proline/glycine betaine ABC transporter permease [Bacillota bacterium]